MFVFMGSYSGDYDSSDDDDSQDEETTDDHSQPSLDDYTRGDGGDDSDQDSGSGGGPTAGSGGGGGGGVITEPPEGDDPADGGENEEEDDIVVVVQEVDALSAMSWSVQPVMKHIEECYGEEIELFYKPAPVRELDPEQEKQKWIDTDQQLGMPVDPSFWDNDPPESTELVNKAFEAAIEQRRGMDYIRAMWRRGVAAGRDISDEEVLIDLASDIGLDLERFKEDLDEAEPETEERAELPFTSMKIHGNPVPWGGRVRYTDFRSEFAFQGVEEQEPQELQGFVEEHGPVATPEVMEVYGIRRKEAVQRLQDVDGVSSFEAGGEDFWY